MKRFLLLITSVLLLTGCQKEENKPIDMTFDDKYYDIMTPYKTGVGNNYVRPSVVSTYDYSSVDAGLMDISVKYFDPDEFKFQAGQYLDEATLTELLSDEKLNKTDAITVDEDCEFTSDVVLNHPTNTRMILAASLLEAIKNCKYFLNTNNSGK